MKKRILLKIFIAIAAVIMAVLVYGCTVWFASDRIVKLSFTGLENMFHVRDEYHAVAGPFSFRVPEALAQTAVNKKISVIGDTDDEAGRNFLVQVTWSENGRPMFEGKQTLIHSFDAKYVIEVSNGGPEKIPVTREEEKIMIDIASHFYDFSKPYVRGEGNWVAYSGGHTVIFSFNVYFNGDKVLFSIHESGGRYYVYSYKNGKFTKVMKVPEKGDFDVVIWKR